MRNVNGMPFFASTSRVFSEQVNQFSTAFNQTTSSHRQEGAGIFTSPQGGAPNHYQREHAYFEYPPTFGHPSTRFFKGAFSEPYSLGRGFSAASPFFQDIYTNRNYGNLLQGTLRLGQLFKQSMNDLLGQTFPYVNLNDSFLATLIYLSTAFSQYHNQNSCHGFYPFASQSDHAYGSWPFSTSSENFSSDKANAHDGGAKNNTEGTYAGSAKSNTSSSAGKPERSMSASQLLARNELCVELGLPADVSDTVLHKNYKTAMLKYHPDKCSLDKKDEYAEIAKRLTHLNSLILG